ncbi:MAG: hypothetical protein IIC51_12315 [Planctomycetes bacterium]|nr:hypothetical protein [Planctomycetota bacterium]
MRSNRLISAVAIVGLTILSTNAPALEPPINLSRAVHPIDGPADAVDHSGIPQGANTCPADNVGTLTNGGTIVGSTIGSTDDFVAGCSSVSGGRDEIFEFQVDLPGEWSFDTCTVPACWDTTLEIREETGGGCPGDFVACDGDGCNVCVFESSVQTFLIPASTYYLIVDGWSTSTYGDFTVTATLVVPGCTSDAECDDGLFCNGQESCDVATGLCLPGTSPCLTFEGYAAPCNDFGDNCTEPNPCFTWMAGAHGDFWLPQASICPDTATWVFDDVQTSHHTTRVLDYYTTPIIARTTPPGASPPGTIFLVNQALFTVQAGTCNPDSTIAGSQCNGHAAVGVTDQPGYLRCSGTMPDLPNNAGDFSRCETDFFMAMRWAEPGAGMAIAGGPAELGGPAESDDFGVAVVWIEDCPPTGDYSPAAFGCPGCVTDFEAAVVCATPGGSCCLDDAEVEVALEDAAPELGGDVASAGGVIADGLNGLAGPMGDLLAGKGDLVSGAAVDDERGLADQSIE